MCSSVNRCTHTPRALCSEYHVLVHPPHHTRRYPQVTAEAGVFLLCESGRDFERVMWSLSFGEKLTSMRVVLRDLTKVHDVYLQQLERLCGAISTLLSVDGLCLCLTRKSVWHKLGWWTVCHSGELTGHKSELITPHSSIVLAYHTCQSVCLSGCESWTLQLHTCDSWLSPWQPAELLTARQPVWKLSEAILAGVELFLILTDSCCTNGPQHIELGSFVVELVELVLVVGEQRSYRPLICCT